MSRFLFGLLLIGAAVFLLARLIGKASARRPTTRSEKTDRGVDLVQDPVCLTYLPTDSGLEITLRGTTHRFCGPECAAAFEKREAEKAGRG